MPEMSQEIVAAQIRAVLHEAFEGPPEGFAYFSDHGDDAGLLNQLNRITAEEASREIGGTTIAAHVHHLAFSLHASAAWLRGDRDRPNWPESWAVSSVDMAGWELEQEALREARDGLLAAVDAHAFRDEMTIGITLGNIAHIACHLGAIRQKVNLLRG